MRRELERIETPNEHGARERAWPVVRAAFAEREPVERRSYRLRPALAIAVAVAVLAAVLSPPGRAVLDEIREAVGIERAQPALFSLPASGKLLVASDEGVWVVQEDGSRRLLGDYREATWSPFGRFVAAARENELAALEPDGDVRWTLARARARFPRWGGTRTDTRIAYLSRNALRVVAGDGTGDQFLVSAPDLRAAPPAWRPGPARELAFTTSRILLVVDTESRGEEVWSVRAAAPPRVLEWSNDGRRLLALSPLSLRVYDERGRVVARDDPPDGTSDADAAFLPGTDDVAVIRVHGSQSDVFLLRTGRLLFRGTGEFRQLAASPDGRWLLVGWPTADQWVFVSADGKRIRAVSNVSQQFRSQTFPRVEGWCCGP